MKRTHLKSIIVFAFTLIAISSCSKKNAPIPETKRTVPNDMPEALWAGGDLRMLWHFDPWRCGCINMKENCAPKDIIIRPGTEGPMRVGISIVETGTETDIINYFADNAEYLGQFIEDPDLINGVINGTLTVYVKTSTDPVPGSKYMIFKNADNVEVMAVPFILAEDEA